MTQCMFLNSFKHAHTSLLGMGINVPVESEFNSLCWYSTSEMKFYHEISVCAFCWTKKTNMTLYIYFLIYFLLKMYKYETSTYRSSSQKTQHQNDISKALNKIYITLRLHQNYCIKQMEIYHQRFPYQYTPLSLFY